MDPFTLGLTAVSIGVQLFGGSKQVSGAKEQAAAQQEQIRLEQQVEAQRRTAMELDARRQQREAVRTAQRALALGSARAANQGANDPGASALGGAAGQILGTLGVNQTGISQNLGIGENIFDINAQISQQKIRQSQAATQQMEGAAISSLGQSLFKVGPAIGSMAGSGSSLAGFSGLSTIGNTRPRVGPFG
jgi:hypothetical protein